METVKKVSWVERARRIVRDILGTHLSPARTAASIALGLAIGFSPLLGLHTLLAAVLAFLFGLNRLATFLGTLVFNPWTSVPIVMAQLKLGNTVLGHRHVEGVPLPGSVLDVSGFFAALYPHLVDWAVGAVLISLSVGLVSYPVLYWSVRYLRAHHIHLPGRP